MVSLNRLKRKNLGVEMVLLEADLTEALEVNIVIFLSGSLALAVGRNPYFLFCVGSCPSLFMAILYQKGYPIHGIPPRKFFIFFQKVFSCVDGQMMGRCSRMFIAIES